MSAVIRNMYYIAGRESWPILRHLVRKRKQGSGASLRTNMWRGSCDKREEHTMMPTFLNTNQLANLPFFRSKICLRRNVLPEFIFTATVLALF
jgi:hypothetical protein